MLTTNDGTGGAAQHQIDTTHGSTGEPITGGINSKEAGRSPSRASQERGQHPHLSCHERVKRFFEGVFGITALAGMYFLIDQTREVRRANNLASNAITEAREANRLTQEAQRRAELNASRDEGRLVAQDARAERQLALSKDSIDS